MSIFDRLAQTTDAINAERIAQQRQQVDNPKGLAVGGGYNPVLGTWQVVPPGGGNVAITQSLTNSGVGIGSPVQLTQSGAGFHYDFKPSGGGSGTVGSASTAGTTGGGSTNGSGSGGVGGGAPEDVWVRSPDGGCQEVSYPPGQAPKDSYATKEACLLGQKGDYTCKDGQVAIASPPGSGQYKSAEEAAAAIAANAWVYNPQTDTCELQPTEKRCEPGFATFEDCQASKWKCTPTGCIRSKDGTYNTKAECEAARIPPLFTGGQCDGVLYQIQVVINVRNYNFGVPTTISPSTFTTSLAGKLSIAEGSVDGKKALIATHKNGTANLVVAGSAPDIMYAIDNSRFGRWESIQSITVTVAPGSTVQEPPGGCGNPLGSCP